MKLHKLYTLTWQVANEQFEKHRKYLQIKHKVFKYMINPKYRKLIKWIK